MTHSHFTLTGLANVSLYNIRKICFRNQLVPAIYEEIGVNQNRSVDYRSRFTPVKDVSSPAKIQDDISHDLPRNSVTETGGEVVQDDFRPVTGNFAPITLKK